MPGYSAPALASVSSLATVVKGGPFRTPLAANPAEVIEKLKAWTA